MSYCIFICEYESDSHTLFLGSLISRLDSIELLLQPDSNSQIQLKQFRYSIFVIQFLYVIIRDNYVGIQTSASCEI